MLPDKVQEPPGVQRRGQGTGHEPGIGGSKTGLPEQHFDMPVPECRGGHLETAPRRNFGGKHKIPVRDDVRDPFSPKSNKAVKRGGARAQRWRPKEEAGLEGGL